jgi:hypothetical protein
MKFKKWIAPSSPSRIWLHLGWSSLSSIRHIYRRCGVSFRHLAGQCLAVPAQMTAQKDVRVAARAPSPTQNLGYQEISHRGEDPVTWRGGEMDCHTTQKVHWNFVLNSVLSKICIAA